MSLRAPYPATGPHAALEFGFAPSYPLCALRWCTSRWRRR